jgi:hypothetical protein
MVNPVMNPNLVSSDVATPIVSRLIDKALNILRENPTNDTYIHRLVVTRVLNEYNDAQGHYRAELDHLETANGMFQLGVELTHRLIH